MSKIIITFLSLLMITGCFPNARLNLMSDSSEPLIEFTVEGSGRDKILILPITGVISSETKKTFLTTLQRIDLEKIYYNSYHSRIRW